MPYRRSFSSRPSNLTSNLTTLTSHHRQPLTTSSTTHVPATHCTSPVMENGAITQGEGKDPSSFLSDIIGNPVIVKLNSGVVYKGESQATSLAQMGT